MRVATGMKGLHYVLHAPQGDTYADLLFTMIERRDHRPPVTYTTFQARDLGAGHGRRCSRTAARTPMSAFKPEAMIVGASCTAELIQDDPGGMAETMGLPIPVDPAGAAVLSAQGELRGADETFYPDRPRHSGRNPMERTARITANLIGPTALGFRHRDDIEEITAAARSWGSR